MKMEKKPHKHAEVIKAWANGESIEFRRPGESKWLDAPDPAFIEDYSYRVKPARVYPQTTMDSDETYRAMYSGPTTNNSAQCRAQLVNVGLRHAIDNGQVVTREEFARAIGDRKARDMAVAESVRKFASEVPETAIDRYDAAYKIGCIDLRGIIDKVST